MKKQRANNLVLKFDKETERGTYYVKPDCDFFNVCAEIEFHGFKSLPKGFSRDGYGFASPAGTFLKDALFEAFGDNIKLTIVKNSESTVRKYRNRFYLTLKHGDYLQILEPLRDIRKERNLKSKGHVASMLGRLFPKFCERSESVATIYTYEDDKISKMLPSEDDYELLSKPDIETIARLHSKLIEDNDIEFSAIGLAEATKKRNERVYLQSVIDEFEKRIVDSRLTEADWQRFLQKYILLFNTSYVKAIEKLSIDLRGKYPDFMLVNVYGYIDIYEIKKPNTNLLKYDESRGNYFWDTEVSKAITQTEKYVQMLIKSSSHVREVINDKHSIDVKVVRPHGYVIVGSSKQLENKQMEDDYRLLAGALKNVDIILYDEMINNLRNLINRLK